MTCVDPCGCWVDLIRSAYEVDCRFYADQPDKVSRIRWYFADPDAERLPYRTRFASRNWEQPTTDNGALGEVVPGGRRWYSGENFTGHLGVGTATPESLWFDGCPADEVVTGTECTPGFWEALRAGFLAGVRVAHQQNLQTILRWGGDLIAVEREFVQSVRWQLGLRGILRNVPPPGMPIRLRPKVGLAPVPAALRVIVRRLDPRAGFKPGGRLGKPFAPALRPKHGFKVVPRVPGGGPIRKAVPPPVGFAPILKGGDKVLVAVPPPCGLGAVVKAPGKLLAPAPAFAGILPITKPGTAGVPRVASCFCFSMRTVVLDEYTGAVTTSPATSTGAVEQVEKYAGAVTTSSVTSTGAVEQVESYTGAVTTSSATSAGTYTDTGGVLLSYTGAVTTSPATSAGAVEQVESYAGAVTTSSATSTGVYREFSTVTGCSAWNPSPASWHFTTSGIANSACSACSTYNGNFTVTYTVGCTWPGTVVGACAPMGSSKAWSMGYDAVNSRWFLRAQSKAGVPTIIAEYRLASGSWTQLGNNTLSLATNTTDCASWPATITVIPGP